MFLYLYLYLCLFLRDIMNGVITFVKEKNIAKISEENEKNGMHIIKNK